MNWISLLAWAVVFVILILLKRASQIQPQKARKFLEDGALLIDVRTTSEFAGGHLPGALNLPLDTIEGSIARHAASKEQVLLLHCQSGMRSGLAARKLRSMGYTNVHNLGSYARASGIVGGK